MTTEAESGTVPTVLGDIDIARLGSVLMHEHVFILSPEFAEYPEVTAWAEHTKVADAVGRLSAAKAAGVDTIVDLTVIGMGRSVSRLAHISRASGVSIVVATGLYTFDELPKLLQYQGPGTKLGGNEFMMEMFLKDIRIGIGDTGIRAAVLKCATDEPGVTPGVERVLRAVAQVNRETDTPISTHAHAGTERGIEQLDIFDSEGVEPSRVVIGHCGDTDNLTYLRTLADRGAYLGMDRFGTEGGHRISPQARIDTVAQLCKLGYSSQLVLSHDASCWMDWAPRERLSGTDMDMPTWHYGYVHTTVLPRLLERGVTSSQLEDMLVRNPRRILRRSDWAGSAMA